MKRMLSSRRWFVWAVYGSITVIILLPLLLPGYIFALDMVFTPALPMPDGMSSSYLFRAVLHYMSLLVPGWVIQKILLFTIVLLTGVGAHKLVEFALRRIEVSWYRNLVDKYLPYYAGILYTINPFTYERFMDGQYSVLFGHALMPFLAKILYEVVLNKDYSGRKIVKTSGLITLIALVSIHSFGMALILLAGVFGVAVWDYRKEKRSLFGLLKCGTLIVLITTILNSFWLIPALFGDTNQTLLINEFDERHLLTFRTVGGSDLEVAGNTAAMYGYWGEVQERFVVPKNIVPGWQVLAGVIIGLAVYGAYSYRKSLLVRTMLLVGIVAFVLAVGIAAQPFEAVNRLLISSLPFFSGYREPQKFVSMLVLVYAFLGSLGISALLQLSWFKRRENAAEWLIIASLLLPILYVPNMFFGFSGQLRATDYPTDWYAVDKKYAQRSRGKILFLPWHQYMYFDFAGRIIANPAENFFSGEVVAGDNSEIGLIKRQTFDRESLAIEAALEDKENAYDLSSKLNDLGIEYVFLAKTADYDDYSDLHSQHGVSLVTEYDSLYVFKIQN